MPLTLGKVSPTLNVTVSNGTHQWIKTDTHWNVILTKALGTWDFNSSKGTEINFQTLLQVLQFKSSPSLETIHISEYITHVRVLLGGDQMFPVGTGSAQPLEGSQWPLEPVWKWTSGQMASHFHIPSACFLTLADTEEHPKFSGEMGFQEGLWYFYKVDVYSWPQQRKRRFKTYLKKFQAIGNDIF